MENMYDLIIIGAGPAGMTAGIYASRLGLKTLLITKSFGGQMAKKAVAIENYPGFESISGFDLVRRMEKHLKSLNIDIEIEEVTAIKKGFIVSAGKDYNSKAVIITSGSEPRHLDIIGEKEYVGKGLSYCAVCDGPMFKDKTVAIIGGGNAGFETAIFLKKIAKKIYILETGPEIKAFKANQEMVTAEVITNAVLKEIKGSNFVDSIVYEEKGERKTLDVQGVFIEAGYEPAISLVKDLVELNKKNEIKINKACETKTSGLFAAGDLTDGLFRQIIIAAGEGAKAALSAYNYIHKQ
jgi:thioredoxin-disulfide reductase